ncbi:MULTISPECIES: 2-oxo-4-hydroxy-4-carboxy-5-ureidoimidazoline decarboxylase [Acinetobacter]|uniref:2-oxo-4-hydroxy-4-carboxy-5-ureidoimidazoline decarboxylase n=1 Tax=Acinetobacter pecorum TaxID=2762215 RepID=A0ABR8W0I8_9GAMM|nr:MULTISPECIES: 2-oxo-4-hydroxy-4-carboxy-5-ureidoimidazoline decarboxylase [Acinetobacter]MBD8010523.1 2-oxo-4-hydroxy-4-carboxy-5-ureidoimidazoline decarboxylase [Acinetobacter pecorum]OAL83270.1 OHCU decarboxylase [Acinetobacter sp. SFD]
MQLFEFNQASTEDAMIFLKHCVQIPSWSTELVAKRPYASIEEVLTAANQQAATWRWDEIKAALDNHPRIGEKKAQAELSEIEKSFSNREQSGIAADDDTRLALLKGNLAYEKKYGFIFLIKAAGLSSEAVLHALTSRLQNDPEIEKCIVHQQLAEIALSRLAQELHA